MMSSGNDSYWVSIMKVANWLVAGAASHPERPALICGGQTLDYAELEQRSAARRPRR